jgi:SRSO17 transposase
VEECFAQTKGEVGMDHYEVRTWTAWHRFVTFCLLAHAYLAIIRYAARDDETAEKGAMLPA